MWEPRRLTTLWAFMACYMDSFTFFLSIRLQIGLKEISVNPPHYALLFCTLCYEYKKLIKIMNFWNVKQCGLIDR
jgi:hypothetical protein